VDWGNSVGPRRLFRVADVRYRWQADGHQGRELRNPRLELRRADRASWRFVGHFLL